LENNNITTLSNGPQFYGGKSAYLFVLVVTLLFVLIGFIVSDMSLGIIIIIPIITILSSYTLDIRGVQIDLTSKRVRRYKQNLIGKKGKWLELSIFNKIILTHEFYKVSTTDYSDIIDGDISTSKTTHGHFVVRLIGSKSKKSLIITEEMKYSAAKKTLAKVAKDTGFEKEDTYHAKLVQSINMRSWQ